MSSLLLHFFDGIAQVRDEILHGLSSHFGVRTLCLDLDEGSLNGDKRAELADAGGVEQLSIGTANLDGRPHVFGVGGASDDLRNGFVQALLGRDDDFFVDDFLSNDSSSSGRHHASVKKGNKSEPTISLASSAQDVNMLL